MNTYRMSWQIRPSGTDYFEIIDRHTNVCIGSISKRSMRWHVSMDAKAFNWECGNFEQALGYVRGIERAVEVNAKETGRVSSPAA